MATTIAITMEARKSVTAGHRGSPSMSAIMSARKPAPIKCIRMRVP